MKIVPNLGRYRHMARVSIFLIAIALVIGIAACNGSDTYQLTISSTTGGSVATPAEGTSTYKVGTVVELLATPDDGYYFHVWMGDTDEIADPDSASTNITMNGNYTITASFRDQGEDGGGEVNPIQP